MVSPPEGQDGPGQPWVQAIVPDVHPGAPGVARAPLRATTKSVGRAEVASSAQLVLICGPLLPAPSSPLLHPPRHGCLPSVTRHASGPGNRRIIETLVRRHIQLAVDDSAPLIGTEIRAESQNRHVGSPLHEIAPS